MRLRFFPLLLFFTLTVGLHRLHANHPHIVYILADDLGYGDLGCYNERSKIPTPNMDRLAHDGMRFTDAHTPSSVCSPTRYSVLTGRYCWRTWLNESVLDGFDPPLIEASRLTVPALLKRHGYVTSCIGKWHLGMTWHEADRKPMPVHRLPARPGRTVDFSHLLTNGPCDRGFDHWFGISASLDMSPYCYISNRRTVGTPDRDFVEVPDKFMGLSAGMIATDFCHEEVLPDLTKRAVTRIQEHASADSDHPLFLYFPLPAPHLPVVPSASFRGQSDAGRYGDFVAQVDHTVGEILTALENAKLAESTLVILTSDNGGLWHWWDCKEADDIEHGHENDRAREMRELGHQSNGLLRGKKADIWEGGHRVPFIARWPGNIPAGSTSHELIELTDLMATCAAIVGGQLPEDAAEDSYNLLPALLKHEFDRPIREAAVHHSLHGMFAVRKGPWKLIVGRGSGGFSRPRFLDPEPGEPEGQLYHLANDPGETHNVWSAHPKVVTHLTALLHRYQESGRSVPLVRTSGE